MDDRLISSHRQRATLLALLFASGICLAMLLSRALFAQSRELFFYPWNLFLAWIPFLLARRIYGLRADRSPRFGLLAVFALAWFFFFPNAPYIVTDLVHLKTRAPVPKWFDLLLMVSFAWTGLCLGYLSLYLMHEVVRSWLGRRWGWRFVVAMLALSSFGIYLGRFLRWNSWDVLARPLGLASDLVQRVGFANTPELLAFSATFFAFSLLTYATLFAVTHLHGQGESARG